MAADDAPEGGPYVTTVDHLAREIRRRRLAARLSQPRLAQLVGYSRQYVSLAERKGNNLPSEGLVQALDAALGARGALVDLRATARVEQQAQRDKLRSRSTPTTESGSALASSSDEAGASELHWSATESAIGAATRTPASASGPVVASVAMWVPEYADETYLDTVHTHVQQLVSLDNRFGGADLLRLAERFFRTVYDQLGKGAYQPSIRKDLLAAAGELAEVGGWLAYDADRQDVVRRLNQEALYFNRLAGDRSMELLTLQNASMHAGFLGRPQEALDIADMVLDGDRPLSPRLRSLFLTRKARALAQGGDGSSVAMFDQVKSLYREGVRDNDPSWVWWVDERELAWHEAMCHQSLGETGSAIAQFERSVEATPATQVRSQYLHLSYLLDAQVALHSWGATETTIDKLAPLATEVGSTRTVVRLRRTTEQLARSEKPVPSRVIDASARLRHALTLAPI